MPSRNTSILSARVKDKTISVLSDAACGAEMTVPMLLNLLADYINVGAIKVLDRETLVLDGGDEDIDLSRLEKIAERDNSSPQEMLDYLVAAFEREK